MKRFLILLFAASLLLCSCGKKPDDTTVTAAPVTADTEIIFSAAGFDSVYDETLKATWVYKSDVTSGLFARLLVYGPDSVSLRVICTDAEYFEYNGKKYDIKDGDTAADKKMIRALDAVSSGADCKVGERAITDEERKALASVLSLYNASFSGTPYGEGTKSADTALTGDDGNRVYFCAEFTVKYPATYELREADGEILISSVSGEPGTVSIKREDTAFSPVLADGEAVKRNVENQGGTLKEQISAVKINGRAAYKYSYEKDKMFITQYFVDGGDKTYIITAGSYDGGEPERIALTFEINEGL